MKKFDENKKLRHHVEVINGGKTMGKRITPLSQDEIAKLWDSKAMYIVWDDGSDSLLQENGYTLEEALDYASQGYEIDLD